MLILCCLFFRLSLSDSDSDNSADSCLPSREPPPGQKLPPANNKVLHPTCPYNATFHHSWFLHCVQSMVLVFTCTRFSLFHCLHQTGNFSLFSAVYPNHQTTMLSELIWVPNVDFFYPQASGRKSPESCNKPEKILKKGTYDKVCLRIYIS